MWDSRVNGESPMVGFLAVCHWELTVRVRACPTMEADHDMAICRSHSSLRTDVGTPGPTVEHVALGYRIRPCNIDYER